MKFTQAQRVVVASFFATFVAKFGGVELSEDRIDEVANAIMEKFDAFLVEKANITELVEKDFTDNCPTVGSKFVN